MRDELIMELERQEIPIHYNKKCSGIRDENENSAVVVFEDGTTVEADFVIGADGIHSRIRPFFAPDAKPEFSGLMGVMGTVMADMLNSPIKSYGIQLPCMLFGASGSFAIMPSNYDGSEVAYFATIEAKDRGGEGWQQLEKNTDELHSMLDDRFLGSNSGWPTLVKELCEKTPPATLTSWP